MKRVSLRLMVMDEARKVGQSHAVDVQLTDEAFAALASLETFETYLKPAFEKLARGEA